MKPPKIGVVESPLAYIPMRYEVVPLRLNFQ